VVSKLYNDRLVHIAQWARTEASSISTAGDPFGGGHTSIQTISTISCYAYADRSPLIIAGNQNTALIDWQCLLPLSTSGPDVDDKLLTIVDADGTTVLSEGRIKERAVYHHRRHKLKAIVVRLTVN